MRPGEIRTKDLLAGLAHRLVAGTLAEKVGTLTFDSRQVEAGGAFVAVPGVTTDGHRFVGEALRRGASLVVVQEDRIGAGGLNFELTPGQGIVAVARTDRALGQLASNFYGNPSHRLKLVGITGTNGKTSVATLCHRMARGLGLKSGLISTVRNQVGEQILEAHHTTPDALELNQLLGQMVEQGCTHAFMEVSSHAIVQGRVAGIHFAGGVFTNLSRDHLDYHGTFANYRDAKQTFFTELGPDAFAIYNLDDRNGRIMVQNSRARCLATSLQEHADYTGRLLSEDEYSMTASINGREVVLQLHGRFNLYNLLQVFAVCEQLGLAPHDKLLVGLSALQPVEGRFECINGPGQRMAIVDYAHTPDALGNLLEAVHQLGRTGGSHIILVVGCGGDRDSGKRSEMGRIAAEGADRVILTSDNPRSEPPEAIIAQMREGIPSHLQGRILEHVNRREAIRTACALSGKGDIIVIAGKGHETYQETAGTRRHFDDREEIRQAFHTMLGEDR